MVPSSLKQGGIIIRVAISELSNKKLQYRIKIDQILTEHKTIRILFYFCMIDLMKLFELGRELL